MVKIAENEDGIFVWNHSIEAQARLGIITKEKDSLLINFLKKKLREKNEVNYHMSTSVTSDVIAFTDTLSILHFEEFPSPGENNPFSNDRMKWVQMYFSLISMIHQKERSEFVPLGSFRAHAEGPLIGYYRSIQNMEESEDKSLLNTHLQKLENVKWNISVDEDFVYKIEGETNEELLESFFIGAWAYWLYTAFIVDPRPINLFVELDGLMVNFPVLAESRKFITFITDSLARLTFQLNMSFTIKSPTLFPIPESLVEHLVIQDIQTADMMWSEIPLFPTINSGEDIVWEYQKTFRKMKLALADIN
ncbi:MULTISPECIES: hypothetical protein [unclassified Sporosarcina]|uniref:hypothetical protein n=1 Tax=unclassified Sporosarcina TaxID=2647733 RepID=UPI001A924D0D|nr:MULTISPECIES: hypothetical protein [unclassified Sporosarcina]MBO0589261.1 hypothetical protein [Sporosarcina sp. E16_8]MBO0601968.1 hypothetical protein [Sporosarcina sp. E16_3]